jgi:hypothetical protein
LNEAEGEIIDRARAEIEAGREVKIEANKGEMKMKALLMVSSQMRSTTNRDLSSSLKWKQKFIFQSHH